MKRSTGRYTPPKRTLVLTADVREVDSPRTRERAARRRLVATTGRCPCGAVVPAVELVPGTVTLVAVEHEPDCPAVDVKEVE